MLCEAERTDLVETAAEAFSNTNRDALSFPSLADALSTGMIPAIDSLSIMVEMSTWLLLKV